MQGFTVRPRRQTRVAARLCFALCVVGGRWAAADEIHYFVDERGVSHFSNVPADPRYRLYLRDSVEPGPQVSTARPSVILFARRLSLPAANSQ